MAMMERQNLIDSSDRPKRVKHESGPNYNGEGDRSLELKGIVDVLDAYQDYEGGVNCSLCGKLYKSKVCLVKHLWEHSVYWDKFAGSKNHERVLSIQAALILCGLPSSSCGDTNKMTELLVTSPVATHNQENVMATPKKEMPTKKRPVPKTPKKRPRVIEIPKKRPKLADL